ncbi:hypothetical protein GOB85_17970 [Acetobacter sp. LMG 1636]|uniref:HTH hxlR-type domain-containing protein n=1 Tax=Acetobacter fallax TaxID=1737473 RepID=A0ABX0KE89_9PROT|nr:hypothetical protein [Acetobacter fallax]NHO37924.1 hypothetical protein [Acetobacter fallax]
MDGKWKGVILYHLFQGTLRLAGLTWLVPDFSTLSRRQKSLRA